MSLKSIKELRISKFDLVFQRTNSLKSADQILFIKDIIDQIMISLVYQWFIKKFIIHNTGGGSMSQKMKLCKTSV